MRPSARSLLMFAYYLFVMGWTLILIPNVLLGAFGLPETQDVWVRVVGVLALILGYYYFTAAKHDLIPIVRASVWGRASVIIFFAAFVVLGLAPPVLLVFGLVDLAAAMWTHLCLRRGQGDS